MPGSSGARSCGSSKAMRSTAPAQCVLPPRMSRGAFSSTSTRLAPFSCAETAAESAALPAPTTMTSYSSIARFSSGEAAGQMHELAHAGSVEMVDAAGKLDDACGDGRLEPGRQAVADLDEVLGLSDRRRPPLAARPVAARLQDAPAVELDPQQDMHFLEATGDCRVEAQLELAQKLLHVGLRQPRVGEGANTDLAVQESAGRRILQRELSIEARLRTRPVDVGHDRRGQDHAADRSSGGNLR